MDEGRILECARAYQAALAVRAQKHYEASLANAKSREAHEAWHEADAACSAAQEELNLAVGDPVSDPR